MFFVIGCEERVNIIEEYDRQSLYPIVLKCYYYLFLMVKSKVECVNQIKDAKFDLEFFEQTPITNEPTIELSTSKMLIFMCYQVNSKEIKCLFQWRANMKRYFLLLVFWPNKF